MFRIGAKPRVLAVVVFSFLIVLACGNQAIFAAKEAKTIVLEQQGTLAGKQTVYLAPDAIRIDNKQLGVTTISSAPDWKIITFNPTRKVYFETELARYRGTMSHIFLYYGIDMTAYKFELIKKTEILGHPCDVLRPVAKIANSDEDKAMAQACKSFWVATGLDVPQPAADMLAKQLCLPASHKVPLRMDYIQNLVLAHALETTKWTNESRPKSWFELPAGFVKKTRQGEVLVQDDSL